MDESVVWPDGTLDRTAVHERIDQLHRDAERAVEQFSPPSEPPDEDRAMACLRSGAGQVIGLYLQTRTGGRLYAFDDAELSALESALNTWFELYAACYGADIESSVSVRTAASALIDTEDIDAVARICTGVPNA